MNTQLSTKMHNVVRISFLACTLLFGSILTQAQNKSKEDNADTKNVVLFADERLSVLTGYQETAKPTGVFANNGSKNISGSIHSARGYRVIIYSGIDRAKANSTKADFMRRHPGTRVYMSYALPQYRVKVGDYTSRQEANEFYRKLSSTYSPCMIVPDIVEVNTFRKND